MSIRLFAHLLALTLWCLGAPSLGHAAWAPASSTSATPALATTPTLGDAAALSAGEGNTLSGRAASDLPESTPLDDVTTSGADGSPEGSAIPVGRHAHRVFLRASVTPGPYRAAAPSAPCLAGLLRPPCASPDLA